VKVLFRAFSNGEVVDAGFVEFRDGRVEMDEEARRFLSMTNVVDPKTNLLLTEADGLDYVKALLMAFRGSYFWAEQVP